MSILDRFLDWIKNKLQDKNYMNKLIILNIVLNLESVVQNKLKNKKKVLMEGPDFILYFLGISIQFVAEKCI